jgi:hypothetical protein
VCYGASGLRAPHARQSDTEEQRARAMRATTHHRANWRSPAGDQGREILGMACSEPPVPGTAHAQLKSEPLGNRGSEAPGALAERR